MPIFRRNYLLSGGLLNDGNIARFGDTVERQQDHPWPAAVSEALDLLHQHGFSQCPRELQRVNSCSVVLNYIPGRCLPSPVPRWATSTRVLLRTTALLKRFSDLSGVGSLVASNDWLTGRLGRGNSFIHGDPHPTNIVFDRFRQPRAIIDFELATIGDAVANLISMLFTWGPLEPMGETCWKNAAQETAADRVAIVLGLWQPAETASEIVEALSRFVEWRIDWMTKLAEAGNIGAAWMLGTPTFRARHAYAVEFGTKIVQRWARQRPKDSDMVS